MRCLIVGADNLGATKNYLNHKIGVTKIIHWDGRRKKIPSFPSVELVIIITSFINHKFMYYVKGEAKKRNIKLIYLKRGKSEINILPIKEIS